jgi:biopolymer transport protein ExbD
MPVHAAGPRLFRSIKFEHLGKQVHGGRASNVSLNLTPFVDMMTILVTFLLMVFSASGELLRAQEGLEMPLARQQQAVQRAPVVTVSEQDIKIIIDRQDAQMPDMSDVGSVPSLLANPPSGQRIEGLYEKLKVVFDDVQNNIAAGNKKMFSQLELDACKREKDGLPPQMAMDKEGNLNVITYCPEGLVLVQADKNTDARIISMVVNTARLAGFGKMLFAVKYDKEAL